MASFSHLLGLRAYGRVIFAFGRQQDVARANLLGCRVGAKARVVVALDVLARDFHFRGELGWIDSHESDLPAIGNSIVLFVRIIMRRNLGVGRIYLRLEVVGEDGHDIQRDLFVAALVFALELGVGNRHPLGETGAELVQHQAFTHRFFEFGGRDGRRLLREQLAIPLLSDELPVVLQTWDRHDLRPHFGVAHGDTVALGLRYLRLLLNHLLKNLLRYLHLPEQIVGQLPAV